VCSSDLNHSHTHPLFCFRSPGFIEEDLRRAQLAIQSHTGVTPVWFRAPFGARWFGMRRAQRRLGLTGVMWTSIGRDWKLPAAAVVDRLVAQASNGAILCLHDGRELRPRPDIGVTLDAVNCLVPLLLNHGYEFETISHLLCLTT
jgi:peptidoglycan/xylan/chitin deacetylase (PgdA/CDA1 family)